MCCVNKTSQALQIGFRELVEYKEWIFLNFFSLQNKVFYLTAMLPCNCPDQKQERRSAGKKGGHRRSVGDVNWKAIRLLKDEHF